MVSGGSYLSQSEPLVHFGLGDAQTIDSVIVYWPSGIVQTLEGVNLNEKLEVVEPV